MLATIGKLNADPRVSGILVLRPLPVHIPEHETFAAVDPRKDVEGMHPWNIGLLAIGTPRFVPSTPAACFYLLDAYARSRDEEPSSFYRGKTLVIVGRSTSVGKPLAFLGLQRDATVVMCHSKTFEAGELADYTRRAHILIAAAGEPGLIHGDMVQTVWSRSTSGPTPSRTKTPAMCSSPVTWICPRSRRRRRRSHRCPGV